MISVVILTKNEEKNIIDCLETVSWADEIIIVDDFSEDRTLEVIKSLNNKKIKTFKNNLDGNFGQQRNFGLSKTTKDWVLYIDADERVTKELKEEINSIIINREKHNSGYMIKRADFMWGKKLRYGEAGGIKILRFAKRGAGAWVGRVHEIWQVDGKIGELEEHLDHYPHPTIAEFLSEINKYTTIRAEELYTEKIQTSFFKIIAYTKGKFVINYFLKLGFLDGIQGLVNALMMSFHSFLVRSKLWLLWQKNS
jgi:glycosyltransferase involved in cell wall biosynthesis